MTRIAVFDTETTGLPQPAAVPLSRQPQIIEFGMATLFNGEIEAEVNRLFNPQRKLPQVITKITGIVDADLADQPCFDQFIPELAGKLQEIDVLLAHNADFDRTMLEFELARAGVEDFPWPRVVCTMQEFHVLMGFKPRLVDAYEYFTGDKLNQTHRAIDDVRALVKCCQISGLLEAL